MHTVRWLTLLSQTLQTGRPASHMIRTRLSSMTCMLHRPERYHLHHRGGTPCYFVPTLHLFSKALSVVLRCGGQLLNVTFNILSARCIRWPGFVPVSFMSLCHRRRVTRLSMLHKVNSNSNHSLFCELQSASTIVRHTRAAATAHTLEFNESRSRTSQIC